MKAVQRPDGTLVHDLAPGEWCWQPMTREGRGEWRAFAFRTPSPSERGWGMLNQRGPGREPWWEITGDGDTITVRPSIHNNPGAGEAEGEWHGFLEAGHWRSC